MMKRMNGEIGNPFFFVSGKLGRLWVENKGVKLYFRSISWGALL